MATYLDTYRKRTTHSERLFKRAKQVIPGGVTHNYHYFPPYPVFVKGAKGRNSGTWTGMSMWISGWAILRISSGTIPHHR